MPEEPDPGMLLVGNEQLAGASMVVQRSCFGRWPIQMHQLTFHKLTLVVRGSGSIETARERQALRRDCLFLTHPFTPHAYPAAGRFDVIQVQFDARQLITRLPQLVDSGSGLRRMLQQRSSRPTMALPVFFQIPAERSGLIAGSMAALLDQYRASPDPDDPLLQARFLVLLADAIRLHAERTERSVSDYSPLVALVADHLLLHYQDPVELADLARLAAWSPAHLVRRFKRETGMTPIAWLNRVRIEQACHELLTTSHSISAIAGRVGFNEIPYFNRRFKSLMGVTPSAWRFARK